MKPNHHRSLNRVVLLVLLAGFAAHTPLVRAETSEQVVSAEQLKTKAFEALRLGQFQLTNDYLSQAARISDDPAIARMADWTSQFEAQRRTFVSEREEEYQKLVDDVHKLIDSGYPEYAVDVAAKAYPLSDNKDGFRAEPWVRSLLGDSLKLAEKYEAGEQWLKSLRIYSSLSAIEPENAEWKERLKTSTRRLRLLAMYTPEDLKAMQGSESKERDAVEQILHPTTRPATQPVGEEAENTNKIDWRESLRGVRLAMLDEALRDARVNYYRDVHYQKMMLSGLNGLRVMVTMPGLEKAFAGLASRENRSSFLGTLDADIARVKAAKTNAEQEDLLDLISDLKKVNDSTIRLPEEVLVSEFADGAFSALDPFSSIIWPSDWEEFQKTTKGEFSGVGIQIQTDEQGNLKVVSPLEDSPAYEAGIKPDYIITHIDGKSARWITLNQAVKRITGPPETDVTLTMKLPSGDVKDYTLKRKTIKVASVKGWLHLPGGGWDYMVDADQKIGYMRITNFTKTTSDDMNAAIAAMGKSGVRGIIMDLRYNPGGLLNSATEIVDRFISPDDNDLKGDIVSTRPDRPDSPNQSAVIKAHRRGEKVGVPIIVLVNQFSASASEIVSGALKDHDRALIVGERTFGKGSVQMLYPLGGGQQAVLKLTTSHYYLPRGKCIHREENSREWGVEPDVTVEMTPEQMRAAMDARQDFDILHEKSFHEDGEARKDPLSSDPQLSAALLLMRLQLASGQIITASR